MKCEPHALMQTRGNFKIWLSNYWSKFALTLCWKNDGSRYLSNLSSYFTSDFFHFTCERKTGFKFWFNDEESASIPKMRQHTAIKGGIQYSLNKTLESLCLAPVWFCLRWSGLHQQFGCHWNRSPASCMSTGNDLLRFHRPRQQCLQKKVNVRCVIDPTHNEVEIL